MPPPPVNQLVEIEWQSVSTEIFEQAQANGQLIVLYFAGAEDEEEILKKVDIGDRVRDGAIVCIRVEAREDATLKKQPVDEEVTERIEIEEDDFHVLNTESISRIEQDDLWVAYDIEKAGTFVVADRFGNPLFTSNAPQVSRCLPFTDRAVSRIFEAMHEHLPKAEKLIEEKQFGAAMVELKMFLPDRWVGYDEIAQAQALYDKLYNEGVEAIDNGSEALEALVTLYKGSELEDYAQLLLHLAETGVPSIQLPSEAEEVEDDGVEIPPVERILN